MILASRAFLPLLFHKPLGTSLCRRTMATAASPVADAVHTKLASAFAPRVLEVKAHGATSWLIETTASQYEMIALQD
eukprot:3496007-Pleurochrysis_carterae.AAC.9